MRVVQADPGVDGWWLLVEGDDGNSRLVSFPDDRGRKAPQPSAARVRDALAALSALPPPPDVLTPTLAPADPIAEVESAAELIDRSQLSDDDVGRLDAAIALLAGG